MTELDLGVWRVGRADGPDLVARWFPAGRDSLLAAGEADILRYLAEHDFPAERASGVSVFEGRGVLATRWAAPVPRQQRRESIRAAGGLRQLGDLLGRLHTLPPGRAGETRPGGAWHHLADGLPAAEVAAAVRLLDTSAHLFAGDERQAFEQLRAEVAALDSADGLPGAFTHPDFVLANVVATEGGMVVVDWAGAGTGPRVWSLAFLHWPHRPVAGTGPAGRAASAGRRDRRPHPCRAGVLEQPPPVRQPGSASRPGAILCSGSNSSLTAWMSAGAGPGAAENRERAVLPASGLSG